MESLAPSFTRKTNNDDGWLLIGLYVIGFGLFVWWALPYSWTNALWYGLKYKVALSQVHTSDKPSDCDWGRAQQSPSVKRQNSAMLVCVFVNLVGTIHRSAPLWEGYAAAKGSLGMSWNCRFRTG
jgi:hypothetical protein